MQTMQKWMTDIISRLEDDCGISVTTEIKNMLWDGRTKAYIVNALRKSVMLYCNDKFSTDPSYAERALLALMVTNGLTSPKDRREGRVLFNPPELAERRALVSKNLHVRVPDVYCESLAWCQATPYRVNTVMLGLLMEANLLEEWEAEEADRVVCDNDGIFYLDCFMDFRGRIYTNHYGSLSPQANQNVRAMVDFGYETPVGLCSDNYNMLMSVLQDEYKVNWDNYTKILKNAKSLLATKAHGKKTAGVIRAAMCLKEIATTGKSSYIVQQDATCSGFQHMAALTRDRDLGSLVNLTGGTRSDLYMAATDFLCEQGTAVGVFLADHDRDVVRSELAKPTVMLTGYASTAEALALSYLGYDGKAEYTDKSGETVIATRFKDVKQALKQGVDVNFNPDSIMIKWLDGRTGEKAMYAALTFAREFQEALFTLCPAVKVLITSIKGAALSHFNKEGTTFAWVTPLDLYIELSPWKVTEDTHTVSFQSGGVRKSMNVLSLRPDSMGGAAGALPNLIHSLDACLVHMVNLARIELGMPWADIHDSFGSTIGDVKRTVELVNDAFVQVHTKFEINNVLQLHNRPILSKGDLCLSELEQIIF